MGKEAKIGLAVILILLVTFGVVLARRLTGSTESAAADKGKSEAGAKDGKSKSSAPSSPSPTVVPPKTAPNKPAQTPAATAKRWSGVGDRNSMAQTQGTGQPKASPPFPMPRPTAPVAAGSYPPYGNAQQSAQISQTGQATQRYDPFQTQSSPPAAGSPAQTFDRTTWPGAAGQLAPPAGTGQATLRIGVDPSRQSAHAHTMSSGAARTAQSSLYRPIPQPIDTTSRLTSIPGRSTTGAGQSDFRLPLQGGNLRREDGTYEVRPNDSYWVISENLYGSGAYFKALAEHNRDRVPREDRLEVGDVILAPGLAELEKTYPDLCPKASRREILRNRAATVSTRRSYLGGRTYAVQEGDTLFDIARYELGKASRWPEIHELNRDVLGDDYNLLSPGLELVLPDDGRVPENMTQLPGGGSVYQR